MPIPRRNAITEAGVILTLAAILGFLFTGITGKGLFKASPAGKDTVLQGIVSPATLAFAEARELYLRREGVFIDARSSVEFGGGHIPGAVSLPLQEFEASHLVLSYLPKDWMIITYCDGADCNSSTELALRLHAEGYSNVKVFFGGWKEWCEHKEPTDP